MYTDICYLRYRRFRSQWGSPEAAVYESTECEGIITNHNQIQGVTEQLHVLYDRR
jgi:hypothetical protein